MDGNDEALFARIRAHCRHQRWHGPDINNPFRIVARERLRQENERQRLQQEIATGKRWFAVSYGATVYWYDRYGKQYAINVDTDLEHFPLQTDFEYPPATKEELAVAERQLGYPLPSLLRALYANVANGGFGPGYGLEGVRGYTHTAASEQRRSRQRYRRPVDLAMYLRRYGSQTYFEFPWYVWPDSLFPLCEWGCGYFSLMDCVSGRVFYEGAGKDGYGLRTQAHSLSEWLDLWLRGTNLLEEWTYPSAGGQHDA